MDPNTNTGTPAGFPASTQDANAGGTAVPPVTPLSSYVGSGTNHAAGTSGTPTQSDLLAAAINAFIRNDDDPNSAEVARAVSDFERMDMFLISTCL